MVDVDQAMAALGSTEPSGNSEPEQVQVEQAPATPETAPAGENKELSGSASKDAEEPETKAAEEKQEKEIPQSEYAWAKLNKTLKANRNKLDEVLKALKEVDGVQYDPKNGSLEQYVQMQIKKSRLQEQKAQLEDNAEVSQLWVQLRDFQAKEIFAGREQDYKTYREQVAPKRVALYEEIREKDPTGAVITHLQSSKNAPLLETAFIAPGGEKVFESILSDDEYKTRRNLEELEQKIQNAMFAKPAAVQTPKAQPVTTPSVNDGNAVTNTKTTPSLNDVAKWF